MPRLTLQQKKLRVEKVLETLKIIFPKPKTELHYTHDYELLFAVIMSAQTTDVQVNKVTKKLFKKYRNLQDYANATLQEFEQDISSIGFYRNKAKNVIAAAKKLISDFDGHVPRTVEELVTLPGAARKTANVVQRELFGVSEGIAVDTHVIRLSNQLGLTRSQDPKKIEQDLMKIIPRSDWGKFSLLLILYGRYYWKARKTDTGPLSQKIGL